MTSWSARATALTAASLFGMLGPLARFGADAGVGGAAFTAWRAILGVAFLAVLIVVRGRAAASVGALRTLPRNGRIALAVAAAMGITLNVSIFTAFGLVPIALALMLFYTYPAGVAVVDVALGRERATASRILALGLSLTGVVLVLVGGMDTVGRRRRSASLGVALGLAAAASQVVFVTRQPVGLHERARGRGDAGDPLRVGRGRVGHRRPRRAGRGARRAAQRRSRRGRTCCWRGSWRPGSRRCCSSRRSGRSAARGPGS